MGLAILYLKMQVIFSSLNQIQKPTYNLIYHNHIMFKFSGLAVQLSGLNQVTPGELTDPETLDTAVQQQYIIWPDSLMTTLQSCHWIKSI